jgi:3-oxoacyl-[acyl-carrier protein] reductase
MLIDLTGKVAIVTGGGRGIGREIVTTLAREGVRVVTTDVRQELLDELTAEFTANGWKAWRVTSTCGTPPRFRRWWTR